MSSHLPASLRVPTTTIAFVCMTAVFFIGSQSVATKDLKSEKKRPIVLVQKLQKMELAQVLAYPARVESAVSAVVLADADGIITKIKPLGAMVSRGSSLMQIEQTDPIYQYAPFKVSAPVTGALSSLEVSEGTRVTRGQKIATVVDPTKIQLSVEVPSSDVLYFKTGSTGMYITAGLNADAQPVKVQLIGLSPVVNPLTGTSSALLKFVNKNDQSQVRVGQVGRVEFQASSKKGILVAESAVIYRGAEPFVRVVDGGIAKYRPVGLGRRLGAQFEILKGLAENDVIVARASGFIADNEAVEIQDLEAKPDSKN